MCHQSWPKPWRSPQTKLQQTNAAADTRCGKPSARRLPADVIDSPEAKGPAKLVLVQQQPGTHPGSQTAACTTQQRYDKLWWCLACSTQMHTTQGPTGKGLTGRCSLVVLSVGCGDTVVWRQETPARQTKGHTCSWLRFESVRHSAAAYVETSGAEARAHQTARITRAHTQTHTTGGRHNSPVPPESLPNTLLLHKDTCTSLRMTTCPEHNSVD